MNWIKSVKSLTKEAFSSFLDACEEIPEKVKATALQDFELHQQKVKSGEWVWSPSILSFVPSSVEFERLENYRYPIQSTLPNATRKVVIAMYFKAEKNEEGYLGPKELQAFVESAGKKISQAKAEEMVKVGKFTSYPFSSAGGGSNWQRSNRCGRVLFLNGWKAKRFRRGVR